MSEKVYLDKVLLYAFKFNTKAVDNSIEFYSSDKFIRDSEWDDAMHYLKQLRDAICEHTIDVIKQREDVVSKNSSTIKSKSADAVKNYEDLMDGLHQHMNELSARYDDSTIKTHVSSIIDILDKDYRP